MIDGVNTQELSSEIHEVNAKLKHLLITYEQITNSATFYGKLPKTYDLASKAKQYLGKAVELTDTYIDTYEEEIISNK